MKQIHNFIKSSKKIVERVGKKSHLILTYQSYIFVSPLQWIGHKISSSYTHLQYFGKSTVTSMLVEATSFKMDELHVKTTKVAFLPHSTLHGALFNKILNIKTFHEFFRYFNIIKTKMLLKLKKFQYPRHHVVR